MDGLAELFREDGCGERPGSVYGRTGRYGIVAQVVLKNGMRWILCRNADGAEGWFADPDSAVWEESSDGMHWGYFDEALLQGDDARVKGQKSLIMLAWIRLEPYKYYQKK